MTGHQERRSRDTTSRAGTTSADALAQAVERLEAGLEVAPVGLPPRARRALELAGRCGAPRAPALRAAAAAEVDRLEVLRAVDLAAAEGRSVARALVLAPPVVAPLVAALVTDAPFAVWATAPGRAVLVVVVLLWAAGAFTVRRLVAGATALGAAAEVGDDEALDLVAVGLGAGLGLPSALRAAGRCLGGDRCRDLGAVAAWFEFGGDPPAGRWRAPALALAGARRDGLPMASLCRRLAAEARVEARHRALTRAARLAPRLTLPTTLLLLPAALLVVAAPLLHGLVAAFG